jgi:hypothetical protein
MKRSGTDESIQFVIHRYMEPMLGISLCGYPYLKLAKMLYLSYYWYVFSSTQLEIGQNRFCLELRWFGGEG